MGNHFIKKYSKEDIEKQLKNENLKWIEGTFINMSSKILLEDKEGYKGYQSIGTIMKGSIFKKFDKRNPFAKDNIILWMTNNYKYPIIKFEEYLGQYEENIVCYCEKHGNFNRSWNKIYCGSGCPMCANNIKLTIEQVRDNIYKINPNILIISNEYINANEKLKCKCLIDGYEWESSYHNLCYHGCPECKRQGFLGENNHRYSSQNTICEICGAEFLRCKTQLEHGEHHFCSKECFALWKSENIRGENNPYWNPNLTQEERELGRNIEGYEEWRKQVYERDNYTCQLTGKRGSNLNAHHLNGYNWDKEHRTDINNGITLSEEAHTLFHKNYGYKYNTTAQFNEFKERYLNGEFN